MQWLQILALSFSQSREKAEPDIKILVQVVHFGRHQEHQEGTGTALEGRDTINKEDPNQQDTKDGNNLILESLWEML